MLACPVCGSSLSQAKGPRGIVWVCPSCQGRAVNVSLLRHLIDRQHFNRLWQTAWEGEVRTDRKCPGCQKPMVEVPLRPPPDPLVLDACRPCQFVWFDASELENIPPAPPEPKPGEDFRNLPFEAREAIAVQKVRRMAEEARREEARSARTYGSGWWDIVPVIFDLLRD